MIKLLKAVYVATSLLLTLCSGITYAQSEGQRTALAHVSAHTAKVEHILTTKPKPAPQFSYCPPASSLYKKNKRWWAPNSWRSYSQSFVEKVTKFIGAQWVGVSLGHIICLYHGDDSFTFPISLQRTVLIKPPTGDTWKKQPSGYLVCKSRDRLKCPFPRKKRKEVVDIKKMLRSFKEPINQR